MTKYSLMSQFEFLLMGFVEGFHQGIPEHSIQDLRWYCLPNHSSAVKSIDKIERNIEKEVLAGRMFGPYSKEEVFNNLGFFRTSPLGAVENGNGSFRPIDNFSFPKNDPLIPLVNYFVDKMEFETTWDVFKVVALFFRNLKRIVRLGSSTGKVSIGRSLHIQLNGSI